MRTKIFSAFIAIGLMCVNSAIGQGIGAKIGYGIQQGARGKASVDSKVKQATAEVAQMTGTTPVPVVSPNPSLEQLKRRPGIRLGNPAESARGVADRRSRIYDTMNDTLIMRSRYLDYVMIESQSRYPDPSNPDDFPMTEGQIRMAKHIWQEMMRIVIASGQMRHITVDTSADYYVYAKIPANTKKKGVPSVMFMAHLDCTPEADPNHAAARPKVYENYDGGDIILTKDTVLNPNSEQGRHLKDLVGKTIVVGDGRSLNGADDKTGCAILVTLFERIAYAGKDFEHGDVYFCFSQNEDVGLAAMRMNMSYLDKTPDILIDVDGGDCGKFSVANFTAEGRTYLIKGNSVHASNGKVDGYADARTAAAYFIGQLPPEVNPSNSEGRQGYIHCFASEMLNKGTDCRLSFRIRYFDKSDSTRFAGFFDRAEKQTMSGFPNVDIVLEQNILQYDNVANNMHPQTVPVILKAAEKVGMRMEPEELRAGTTGAMMVAAGLPLPGAACIYSGQQAEHSLFEWACIEELLELTDLCQEIVSQVYNL